jgi:hypothetical protein
MPHQDFVALEITQSSFALAQVTHTVERNRNYCFVAQGLKGNRNIGEIVRTIYNLLRDLQQAGSTTLLINTTLLGNRLIDAFREEFEANDPHFIRITTNKNETIEAEPWCTSVFDLADTTQVLLQTGQLTLQEQYWTSDVDPKTLLDALKGFRITLSDLANDAPKQWGQGEYGDLVVAVQMACWAATHRTLFSRDRK